MQLVQIKVKQNKKTYKYMYSREKLKAYNEKHYKKNFEKISKRNLKKVPCEKCGCYITRVNLKRHQRTQRCLNFGIDTESNQCRVIH